MATKLSHKDVIKYFDEVDHDMGELVYSLISERMQERAERRQAASERMKKARNARGKGKNNVGEQAQAAETEGDSRYPGSGSERVIADQTIQAEVAEQLPVHRGRRGQISRGPLAEVAEA